MAQGIEDRERRVVGPVRLAVFREGYGSTVAKKCLARAPPHAVPRAAAPGLAFVRGDPAPAAYQKLRGWAP